MSSQAMNDRRDRSSRPMGYNGRQQWIPRGGGAGAGAGLLYTPPHHHNNHNYNHNHSHNLPDQSGIGGGGYRGDVEVRPLQMGRWSRGQRGGENGGSDGGNNQSHIGRPQNYRRERTEGREGIGWRGSRDKDKSYQRRSGNDVDSGLPQLVLEIQEKLTKGAVECMICYDMVKRTAPIWSCSSCYSIFHLNCIKKWARAPSAIDTSAEKSQGFNWRCPGCQSVQLTASKEIRYLCFCGKRHDPLSDLYLTPHSCGESCGKPLEKEVPGSGLSKDDLCPHSCVLQCHPGPCPPCKAFAPPRPCPCGKKVITTRCSDRKTVHTCGQVCGKLLECGRHHCHQLCHVGSCGPCKVVIDASCFCKKKSEVFLCGDMMVKGEINADNGLFSCDSKCGRKLMCGNHHCVENCHLGPCGECDLLPSRVKTCYCGKTALQDERKSCIDPIPTCSGTCGKLLPCGIHHCKEKCHSGYCPPCHEVVSQKCRCGSTSRTVECHKTTTADELFICDRPCGRKKKCGRHRCSERCCPLSITDNSASNPHLCSMTCGKKLRCGQHSCESFCHSGHCPPCLETIFTDLTCACGRTSIPPPIPCGTPPPSCQYHCSVPQPCGHQSTHSCHFGDCPPCSFPIAKECVGGHVVLHNIPCGSKDIRCNKLCGKTRRCGLHACARTCHPPPCDSSDSSLKASCGQTCGAPRRDCRHTCTALCHPGSLCPDVRCECSVTIACSCGRITATVPCDEGGNSSSFSSDNVALILQKLPAPLQPVEANERRVPLGQRKLLCDDECAKQERKRVLADAFDITPPSLDALHFSEDPAVSKVLSELLRRDPKWVQAVEERCKYLVLGKNKGSASNIRVHVFCPMLKEKRDAVTLIAERWKLAISSAGWEPKRFIAVHATPKAKAPPRVLGSKGVASVCSYHPLVFDPLVDMDPRMVVSLLDLPSDADISTLVLRFGGECELVWLNDKNALAVFSDPARAATAMRRLDNGSVYQGAAIVTSGAGSATTNPWGGGAASALKGNPWKKAAVKESNWVEDSWGAEEWSAGCVDVGPSAWKGRETSITATVNRWTVLNSDSLAALSTSSLRATDLGKQKVGQPETGASNTATASQAPCSPVEISEVVDDWEEAYE